MRSYVSSSGLAALNVAGEIPSSEVNGPGSRYTVWFQFCPIGCKNCFNPETWSDRVVGLEDPGDIGLRVLMSGSPGLTLSGGEPMSQAGGVLQLLQYLHEAGDPLRPRLAGGVICFSGYELEQLISNPLCRAVMDYCDLVVSGPYVDELRSDIGIGGSTNKRFWYNPSPGRGRALIDSSAVEFDRGIEVINSDDGIIVTGFPKINRKELKKMGLRILK